MFSLCKQSIDARRQYSLFVLAFAALTVRLSAQAELVQTLPGVWTNDHKPIAQFDAQFFIEIRGEQSELWRFDARNGQLQRMTTANNTFLSAQAASDGLYWVEYRQDRMKLQYWSTTTQQISTRLDTNFLIPKWLGAIGQRIIVAIGGQVLGFGPEGTPEVLVNAGQIQIGQSFLWRDRLYWSDSGRSQLVASDGTRAGTRALGQFTGAYYFVPVGNQLLFLNGQNLCRTDGTPEGTRAFFNVGNSNPPITSGVVLGDSMLLFAGGRGDADNGVELWRTNGQRTGTFQVTDLAPGNIPNSNIPYSGSPRCFIRRDGIAWFTALDRDFNWSAWRSDGSAAGTVPVESWQTAYGVLDVEEPFQRLDEGRQVLRVNTARGGREIAIFDGRLTIYDLLRPGGGTSQSEAYWSPNPVFSVDNTYWLSANNGQHGQELWRLQLDGTAALVSDLSPGAAWSFSLPMGSHGDYLYWLHGKPRQPAAVYRAGLRTALPPPPPTKPMVDWLQTIRGAYGNSSDGRWIYSGGLARTPNGIYVAGAGNGFFRQGPGFIRGNWNNVTRNYQGDNFLARLNTQGEPEWTIPLPGYHFGTVGHLPLAQAPDDGVYAGLRPFGRGSVDNIVTEDFGQGLGILLRYDADGQLLWQKRCTLGTGFISQIAADASGDVVVAGTFTNFNAQIANKTITANTSPAYFVAKFRANGDLVWATPLNAGTTWPSLGPVNGMTMDASGQTFILLGNAGQNFTAPCSFGSVFGGVACFAADGSLRWQRIWEGNDLWFPTAIAQAPGGELYVTGRFRGRLKVGERTVEHGQADNNCSSVGFIAYLTPDGMVLNLRKVDKEGSVPQSIQCDEQGNYWIAGYQQTNAPMLPPQFQYLPFNIRSGQVVVQVFSPRHDLLAARTFSVSDEFDNGGIVRLARLPDQKILLMGEYKGMVDTLADSDAGTNQQVFLLQTTLPFTAPPVVNDGELDNATVQLVPNPANDFTDVLSPDPDLLIQEVQVYDVAGRQMPVSITRYSAGQLRLSLGDLPAGIYLITLRQGDRRVVRKLVHY